VVGAADLSRAAAARSRGPALPAVGLPASAANIASAATVATVASTATVANVASAAGEAAVDAAHVAWRRVQRRDSGVSDPS
jgi:hypothetical protein